MYWAEKDASEEKKRLRSLHIHGVGILTALQTALGRMNEARGLIMSDCH